MGRRSGRTMPGCDDRRIRCAVACLIAFGLGSTAHAAPPTSGAGGNLYQPSYSPEPGPATPRRTANDGASETPAIGARQATYISATESGSPQLRAAAESKQPLPGDKVQGIQAEPMPLSGATRDSSDTALLHGRRAPGTPSAVPAVLSMFASLAVVLGLFLGVMWFLRRGLPKGDSNPLERRRRSSGASATGGAAANAFASLRQSLAADFRLAQRSGNSGRNQRSGGSRPAGRHLSAIAQGFGHGRIFADLSAVV